MIQFLSVSKKYSGDNGDIVAINDISFEIKQGEFVFMVGPSGSGKTTIIRLLIREELPSEGKIYFHNEDITTLKRRNVYSLRRKIGVIFQDFKLIPELTAYENVGFAMEAAGKSPKEIQKNVPYLLEIVGLENRMHSFPKQLSGGEKQRVAIARAMANNPKLLIADEPTGNLDPDSAWDIVQILTKINSWGTTVLMSTHGFDIVNTLNKRVIRMEHGHLISDDYRGSYTNLDDFSLKILNDNSKKEDKEEVDVKDFEKIFSSEEDESEDDPSPKRLSNRLVTKLGARPKLKTLNSGPSEQEEDSLQMQVRQESKDEDIESLILTKSTKISVEDLNLTDKQKTVLIEHEYENLKDIIEQGTDKLAKIKEFNQKDLKKIAALITEFVNSIETQND